MNRRIKRFVKYFKSMPTMLRIVIGVAFIIGGILGILPILGFWMLPLGLLILSADFAWARRGYLSIIVWVRRYRDHRRRKKAERKA